VATPTKNVTARGNRAPASVQIFKRYLHFIQQYRETVRAGQLCRVLEVSPAATSARTSAPWRSPACSERQTSSTYFQAARRTELWEFGVDASYAASGFARVAIASFDSVLGTPSDKIPKCRGSENQLFKFLVGR
jgi:hypothetical protein